MIARDDYPRPQFVRDAWMTLNGTWDFAADDEHVGAAERWYEHGPFERQICVPFAYQSQLSGIHESTFHDVVWYRRPFKIPAEHAGKRAILHFGAVDYDAKVWVDGQLVCTHQGGNSSFSVDITDVLKGEEHHIVVRAQDYFEDLTLPRGKQYWKEKGEVMWFTNMTGIWQSVWIEFVHSVYLERVRFTPHLDTNEIEIETFIEGLARGQRVDLCVEITFKGAFIAKETICAGNEESRRIHLNDFNDHGFGRWWSPEKPNLYDVQFTLLLDGRPVDRVTSYFGVRKISIENGKVCLNNKPYQMKLVLDQGYYHDGILTAPSDEAIRLDVELCKQMGFNGARKHQMVADPRYLYWCDKLGLLVWGEMANAYKYSESYAYKMASEWGEVIKRDYNHPCIVAWVPLNESWGVPDIWNHAKQRHHAMSLYHFTKSVDDTRLVLSNDGWEHCISDLCTIHDYAHDRALLMERYTSIERVMNDLPGKKFIYAEGYQYGGEPVLVTEFGGVNLRVLPESPVVTPCAANEREFLKQLVDVIHPMVVSGMVQGYCYTQLTDTETEICGLLTWERQPKIPLSLIRRINEGELVEEL
ncbi:glycoside hydrolase family 2 [Gordoniibacillus kamchatkensis]|uniref:Glycoside hydrolase family 2 n=1 Tax=Gordoniibacillus kamchatkensis TaxID=1590651 RepID=A0ABR5AIM9_9BACL|nr:glycoside hydrolase family 2 [Paenibacillus sp. VKM B-2647]KIL40920.1 glycoside hydrolase family 2 [Paenibacillus sp. VKM B-2647]